MPWTDAVDQRYAFVRECLEKGDNRNFSALCAAYGISRPTGYKWLKRFEQGGRPGLEDRSSAPRARPGRIDPETVEILLALRREYGWGPKKLRRLFQEEHPKKKAPAASTIGELLRARGLVDQARSRRRKRRVSRPSRELAESNAPNDVWCVDFKGEFRLGDRSMCYPLTITDHYTRYVVACVARPSTGLEGVQQVLKTAFDTHGLPKHVRSDNGSPFGSDGLAGLSYLSVWFLRHGVQPEHIDPGRPDQNGRHERMHRTLKREACRPPAKTLRQQQRVFNKWRMTFNEVRPHEALDFATPGCVYSESSVKLGRPQSPTYPGHFEVVRIQKKGHFHWQGSDVFVGAAFRGEPIGLEEVEDDRWHVYYGSLLLGVLDARDLGRVPWLRVSSLHTWRPETQEKPRRGRRPARPGQRKRRRKA